MKSDAIRRAIGDIDQDLIDQAEKEYKKQSVPSEKTDQTTNKKRKILPKILVPAAVMSVLLIIALIAVPAIKRSEGKTEVTTGVPGTTITPGGTDAPGAILPPWKTGLHLTSLVYSTGIGAKQTAFISDMSAPHAKFIDFEDENKVKSETVTVSIAPNTKISGFSGTDLIRIDLRQGEHADCDSVWYDVKKDSVVCLSCLIRDAIKTTPVYIDACIRLTIEGGMISKEAMWAAEPEYEYSAYYELLNTDTARALFLSGKKPTVDSLGIAGTEADNERTLAVLERYAYPTISVIEYGADPGKCLFLITNPGKSVSYGAFIFDFESKTAIKLDGDRVGDPRCYSGVYNMFEDGHYANLTLAEDMIICDNYLTIIVQVPYIGGSVYDYKTNTYTLEYEASTVMVYKVGGEGYALLEKYGDTDPVVSAPVGALIERIYKKDVLKDDGGTFNSKIRVISFKSADNRFGFSVNGGNVFFLDGERLKLTQDNSGDPVVLMKNDGKVISYRLTVNGAIEMSAGETTGELNPFYRSVLAGGALVDLVTGEHTVLTETAPLALALSKNERYAYMYLGDGGIRCFDLMTIETGFIPIGEEFKNQIQGEDGLNFCLFLSSDEKELLLAYYKNGQLTFDCAAYKEALPRLKEDIEFYRISDYNGVSVFNHNFSTVFDFFRLEGKPVTITEKSRVTDLARFLSVKVLDRTLTPEITGYKEVCDILSSPDFVADVAEALIPYMDFSGDRASVSAAALKSAMNGASLGSFNERYDSVVNYFNGTAWIGDEVRTEKIALDRTARMIANTLIRFVTGYLSPDDNTRDMHKNDKGYLERLDVFYKEFNKDIDSEAAEKTRQRLMEVIRPLLPSPTIKGSGEYYEMRVRNLENIYKAIWDEIFGVASPDISYPQFLSEGRFIDVCKVSDFLEGRSALPFGAVSFDYSLRIIDRAALKTLMSELSFEKNDVAITPDASVYVNYVPFLTAGRDGSGSLYLTSFGYSARLTDTQLDRFIKICSIDAFSGYDHEDFTYYGFFHQQ